MSSREVLVRYGIDHGELVDHVSFDRRNEDDRLYWSLELNLFQNPENGACRYFRAKNFHFDCTLRAENFAAIDVEGFRPATLRETVLYVIANPHLQQPNGLYGVFGYRKGEISYAIRDKFYVRILGNGTPHVYQSVSTSSLITPNQVLGVRKS
jgi:hypothetical protein